MKIEKIKLDVSFDFDYEVWGIATPMNDYQFAWLINTMLDIDLVRIDDWEFEDAKKGILAYFARFHYYDTLEWTNIYLIKNKYHKQLLLPELKNFDYVIKIEGNIDSDYSRQIYAVINQLPDIQYMKNFMPEELRSNSNLLNL